MMMKRSISLVTALCLLSLCACAAPGGRAVSPASADGEMGSSVSFTDSLGSTITLEEAPQRVAALIGSYAETWVLAGGEDTLAAVTQDAYDERGLELGEDVTNVGSNQTPELEALFAAQPDLVLLTPDLDGQLALAEPLAAAGIPAAWFKVESFSDYLSMLEICTRLTGRDDLYQANGLDIQTRIWQGSRRRWGWISRQRSTGCLPVSRRGSTPRSCCCGPTPPASGPRTATISPA